MADVKISELPAASSIGASDPFPIVQAGATKKANPDLLGATAMTFTNKTFDTAGSGNSLSINGVAATANTGTGAVVRATSPTLVTPALGTPSALVGTNITGTAAGLTAGTASAVDVAGITGLGTGVATFLATPTSANLATAVTNETGSGALVFATSPTLVTPALGTPSALVATNATGSAAGLTSGITLALKSATTTVDVSAATAPSTGQVLTATDSTHATWQAGGLTNPMTTGGDLIYGGASGVPTRLPNGTVGQALLSNGTTTAPSWETLPGGGDALTSNPLSQFASTTSLQLKGVISDETGSGLLVFATSPTLTTPTLGVATATSLNGLTVTTTTGTLTMTNGKTLAATNSITLSGTDSTVMTFPSTTATIARTDAAQTFTGVQTITNITLPTNGQILLTVPTTDGHSTGPTCSDFNSGYSSSAIGDLVYLDSSATWQKCDANTLLLYNGFLGIALAIAASGAALKVALPGSFVYATAFPTFTIGGPIYMSETAGAVTQTAPTTTDAATRIIGWAVHADKMYFYPSADYITHT